MATPFRSRNGLEEMLGVRVTISEVQSPLTDNRGSSGPPPPPPPPNIDQSHRFQTHSRRTVPPPPPPPPPPLDDEEGVWQQDSMSEDEDDEHGGACAGECFGCGNLPTGSMSSSLPTLHQNQITHLVDQMKAGLFPADPTRHAHEISRIYEEKIRTPANQKLKPGQTALPPWTPRQVKKHLQNGNHPLLKWRRNLQILDKVKETAYKATTEKHSKNRTLHGGVQKRANPAQWKIVKEAIQEQNKMFKEDLRAMAQNYDSIMSLMRDDSALLDTRSRPVAHHSRHAAVVYKQQTLTQGLLL